MKSLKEYIESDSLNEVKVDGINIPDSIEDKVSMFKSCIEKLKKDCKVQAQVEASKKEIQFARKLYDMIVSEKLPNGKSPYNLVNLDVVEFMNAVWTPVWNGIKDARGMRRGVEDKSLFKLMTWLAAAFKGMQKCRL